MCKNPDIGMLDLWISKLSDGILKMLYIFESYLLCLKQSEYIMLSISKFR